MFTIILTTLLLTSDPRSGPAATVVTIGQYDDSKHCQAIADQLNNKQDLGSWTTLIVTARCAQVR